MSRVSFKGITNFLENSGDSVSFPTVPEEKPTECSIGGLLKLIFSQETFGAFIPPLRREEYAESQCSLSLA